MTQSSSTRVPPPADGIVPPRVLWRTIAASRGRVRGALVTLAVVAVLVVAVLPIGPLRAASSAAQSAEHIRSYEVAIVIELSGELLIEETIEYDFGTLERHGIVRDIPVRRRYDGRFDRLYPLDVIEVRGSATTPDGYRVEQASTGLTSIRIGDPDRTISGVHSYVVRYRVRGALNGFADHDELFWNAVGLEWGVPIERTAVRVTAPAEVQRIGCFVGSAGSQLACAEASFSGEGAAFGETGLGPYEGLTVVVAFPPGVVPPPEPILRERWSLGRAFAINPLTVGAATTVLLVVVAVITRLLWRAGRDRRWAGSVVDAAFGSAGGDVETVALLDGGPYPLEYVPPDGLRPGEIGTLVDEIAHPLDVTATIIDLAVRGYLVLEELPKQGLFGWFGKPDWRVTRLEREDDLRPYERRLLDGLFEDGDEVELSSLRTKFVSRLKAVQEALYGDVVERGWFIRSPATTRNLWLGAGVVVLVVGLLVEAGAVRWTTLALVPLALPLGGLVVIAAHRAMPRRTAKGTAALRRVRGFRRFIETAEQERARFAEDAQLFYEYLPYAIVFGVTDRWARSFEGLADPSATVAWYASSRALSTHDFADAMDSFAVTSSGAIASTPGGSGSSGFSGGGSGGGGGGGGGGSW